MAQNDVFGGKISRPEKTKNKTSRTWYRLRLKDLIIPSFFSLLGWGSFLIYVTMYDIANYDREGVALVLTVYMGLELVLQFFFLTFIGTAEKGIFKTRRRWQKSKFKDLFKNFLVTLVIWGAFFVKIVYGGTVIYDRMGVFMVMASYIGIHMFVNIFSLVVKGKPETD